MSACTPIYIPPHRSYRKIHANKLKLFFEMIVLFLVSLTVEYIFLKYLFNDFILFFQKVLHTVQIDTVLKNVEIFGFDIHLLELSFMHTQPMVLFLLLITMIISVFIFMKQRFIPYNVIMWINFFLIIFIIFILYFIFLGQYFPYSFLEYFELYMTAHIGFVFFIFLITLLSIVLVPNTFVNKFIAFAMIVIYYLAFSLVRYALTLLLVSEVSIVFAPILFFTLYLDFLFFVSAYSYFLYKSAIRYQKLENKWAW